MNGKTKRSANSLPGGIAMGVGVCMVVTLGLAAAFAMLIHKQTIGESGAGYGVLGILMLSSFTGAGFAAWLVKSKRMILCTLTSAGYFLSLLCVTALFFGGQYQGVGATALVIFGGGWIAALTFSGQGRTGKKSRRKGYYG